MFITLILCGVIVALLLIPAFRNWILAKVGWTDKTLTDVVSDLEKKAADLFDSADAHRADAADSIAKATADEAEAASLNAAATAKVTSVK